MKCHRHRNRNIDADHADLDLVREFAGCITVPSEDCSPVAELVRVDHLNGSIVRLGASHGEHRSKDLLAIDLHVGRHAVEQRSADETSLLITLKSEVAAVHDQICALGYAGVYVVSNLIEMLLRYERAHLGLRIQARADVEAADLRRQLFD